MLEEMRDERGRISYLDNENFIIPRTLCGLYKEIRLSQRPFYQDMLRLQDHDLIPKPSSDKMSLAYTMLLHGGVEQFERFLMTVYHPNNIYCIHVDTKSKQEIYDAVKSIATCFDNVFLTTKRESVIWEGFSLLKAEINCMYDLLNLDNLVDKHPNLMGKRNVQWK